MSALTIASAVGCGWNDTEREDLLAVDDSVSQ